MQRLPIIAALVLLLTFPALAQRGGGHGGFGGGGHSFGGGGHASFGGGHMGGGFAGRGFSGSHFGSNSFRGNPGFNRGFSRASRGPFLHDGFRGRYGDRDRFRGRDRFGTNCWGYGCYGYGYGYGYNYYPWWGDYYYDPYAWDWSADDSQFDNDYYNQYAIANEMNQQSLEQQQMLDQQDQQMLRQEQADGDQDIYARRAQTPAPSTNQKQEAEAIPPTVLVFRDRRKQEIQNYAIVGPTLWEFNAGRTFKIPLSELDLPATQKANDDRGITFPVSASDPGQ
ncbi:MAG TPA: hypothetical protein VMB66_14020 [Candidatus Acidoferrales bacterium]|nr:hypothetical protein [Candidatus Acidoferrales bacterium]